MVGMRSRPVACAKTCWLPDTRTESFLPVWWFSLARGARTTQAPAQRTLTDAEGAEGAEDRTETQEADGYDPTPPRTPASKEGRPALQA